MSSDLLVGTYKRYKAGTNKLITWLSHAADQATRPPLLSKKTPKKSTPQPGVTKKIAVDQLVTFAQAIVQATDPTIEIPIDILDVTKDAINGRKWACEWYSGLMNSSPHDLPDDIAESDSKHRYFLNALEKVFEILRVEFRKRQPKRKKKIELPADKEDYGNLYLHLELEETTPADQTTAPKPAKKAPASEPKAEVELEDDEMFDKDGEKFFALWCHLQDLSDLRLQIRQLWQRYAAGDISFLVACQTFDKAVRIAENLSIEFSREQDVCCFDMVVRWLGQEKYMCAARSYQHRWSNLEGQEVQKSALDEQLEFLLMPAWCTINDFQRLGDLLKKKAKDPADSTVPSMVYPQHPFGKRLMQLAGDLAKFTGGCCTEHDSRIEIGLVRELGDYYTIWLIHFLDKGEMPPGLLAATAMYFDLYDILGGDLERGIRECMPIIERMHGTADDWIAAQRTRQPYDVEGLPGLNVSEWVEGFSSIVRPGQTQDGREGWCFHIDPSIGKKVKDSHSVFIPLNILTTLPAFAGHAVGLVLYKTQSQGMTLCNSNQIVLAAAHLYRAARLQGSLTREWRDMASVIIRENEIAKFILAGDGTVRGAAAGYCMSLGLPLKEAARAHRPPLPSPMAVRRGCMKMTNLSHFILAADNSGKANPRKCQSYCENKNLAFRSHLGLSEMYTAVSHYSKTSGIKDEALATQWADTKRVSASQLLQLMQEIFVEDDVYLNFSLIRFSQHCVELLSRVVEEYLNHGRQRAVVRKHDRGKAPQMMYEVVYDALWEAAGAEHRGIGPEKTLLFKAAEFMEDFITRQGHIGIEQAQEVSSGYIPDVLKPAAVYGPQAVAPLVASYANTCTVLDVSNVPANEWWLERSKKAWADWLKRVDDEETNPDEGNQLPTIPPQAWLENFGGTLIRTFLGALKADAVVDIAKHGIVMSRPGEEQLRGEVEMRAAVRRVLMGDTDLGRGVQAGAEDVGTI